MLDTVHIIDEYLATPERMENVESCQNFTMVDQRAVESPLGLLAVAATQQALWAFPTSIVQAATSSIPALTTLFSADQDDDLNARTEKERLLAAFVDRATFSPA